MYSLNRESTACAMYSVHICTVQYILRMYKGNVRYLYKLPPHIENIIDIHIAYCIVYVIWYIIMPAKFKFILLQYYDTLYFQNQKSMCTVHCVV